MRAFPIAALLGALTISGCTVGPDYGTPPTRIPTGFRDAFPSGDAATAGAPHAIDATRWWEALGDKELDQLVERAFESNPDLEVALTRLQEARTEEIVVAGGALPEVEASGGAARGSGSNSTRGRVAPPLNAATNTSGLREITEVVGLDAGWEIDFFGKFRREIEAARDDAEAAAEVRNAVTITLISDVARAYMDLRGTQMRLAVAQRNVTRAQQAVDLVQTRFDRGLTNELDVALARRQLATLRAEVAPLDAAIETARNRIAVLLGRYPEDLGPEDLGRELLQPGVIPSLPDRLEPGLPVHLLRRRPDIREAERRLAAATARIGVATAALFPSVALTGGVGMQGQGLGRLPAASSFIWSAGPTAYWPLLDFGMLDAEIDLQDLKTRELLVRYRQTVQRSVEEVDDAVADYRGQQDQLHSLSEALIASARAVSLATQRYEQGLSDFLNVLDAERQQYDLEDRYASAQLAAAREFIALYKALGGGWEAHQFFTPIHLPAAAIVAMFRQIAAPATTAEPPQAKAAP